MPYNLSEKDGVIEMAYAGPTPWHSLGHNAGALQTVREMQRLAGQEFEVETVPLYVGEFGADGAAAGLRVVPGHVAIRRVDKNLVFGVASGKYVPIQNLQCGDIADALIAEGGACCEVAGALGEGERCWLLLKLPETFEVLKGDRVNWYFLLAWGHTGKHSVIGKLTPIRVVCENTLTAAVGGGGWNSSGDISIRHSSKAKVNIEEARKALGIARTQQAMAAEAFQRLAAAPISEGDATAYFTTVIERPIDTAEAVVTADQLDRWVDTQAAIAGLYREGKGIRLPGVHGTLWGAYNAITEYTDHVYPVLKSGEVSRLRQRSVLFGKYDELKRKALAVGLELAGAGRE